MASKRGDNEGTIRLRKDGRWEGRFIIGYHPDGRPKRKGVFGSSRKEVQDKLRDAITQVMKDEYVEPDKMTVTEWLRTWFQVYGRLRWRESTAATHFENIELHLVPGVGMHPIQKLRPEHIQALINKKKKDGYAPGSIRKIMEPLQMALKQALINQLIQRNPAISLSFPAADQKEIEVLTIEEQKVFLDHLPDNIYGRSLRFILGTGLRASELCGLRWQDVEGNYFTIRQGVQRVTDLDSKLEGKKGKLKKKVYVAPPKTKAGKREIPLTEGMQKLLEYQKKLQKEMRLKAGSAWLGGMPGDGGTYVFATEVGTPMDRTNLGRALRTYLKQCNLKNRGVHALRHTFATNCVRAGVDLRTLSEMLGHTKVSFTMQLYVHSDLETKRAAMQKLASLF
jgi:integrase